MTHSRTRAEQRAALIAAGAIVNDTPTELEESFAYTSATPNVVVQNPRVRFHAGIVLGIASLVTSSAVVLDVSSPALEWSAVTTPAAALVLFLGGAFGLGVTTPNVPR